MDHFHYRSGQLCAEDVPLTEIAAQHGTPCYVYSRATIERHWHAFDAALADVDHLVCYAVKANSNLGVLGVLARLGSGFDIVSVGELERVLALVGELAARGVKLKHLDIGGGLGTTYREEMPPSPAEYAAALLPQLRACGMKVLIEPGRAIVGNAGVLLTRVEYLKPTAHKNFAVVDAAMNDLIRPALYDAWQQIVPVVPRCGDITPYDVVGPVCETGDFLGKDRPLCIEAGELLAIRSAGAYGFSMSSQYNSRPRAAELMVDGDQVHVVRRREDVDDLLRGEAVLPA